MKDRKDPYTTPQLCITAFEAKDILLLSTGGDENEGDWKPIKTLLRLEIFESM